MNIECDPLLCPCGDRCENQQFRRGEYPSSSLEVFRAGKKGFGLRTLCPIPSGTFLGEYLGEVYSRSEFERRKHSSLYLNADHTYIMQLSSHSFVDATTWGSIHRFMNHSCDPTCRAEKWLVDGTPRIGFFAARDIVAFDELSFDYKLDIYGYLCFYFFFFLLLLTLLHSR
jgi:SET domain-containing protein